MFWWPGFDLRDGLCYDLADPTVVDTVCALIRSKGVWCVHMALPCAGWGKACRGKPSDAPPGLACARACVRILLVVRECSIFFSIENPRASELWSWGPLVKELQKFDAATVDHLDTDYCTHGTPYRKSTRFVTNLPHLRSHIGTRCSRSAPHVPANFSQVQPFADADRPPRGRPRQHSGTETASSRSRSRRTDVATSARGRPVGVASMATPFRHPAAAPPTMRHPGAAADVELAGAGRRPAAAERPPASRLSKAPKDLQKRAERAEEHRIKILARNPGRLPRAVPVAITGLAAPEEFSVSGPQAQSYLAEVEEFEAWHKPTPSVRRIDIRNVDRLEAVAVNYLLTSGEQGDELKTVPCNFRHGMAAHVLHHKLLDERALQT